MASRRTINVEGKRVIDVDYAGIEARVLASGMKDLGIRYGRQAGMSSMVTNFALLYGGGSPDTWEDLFARISDRHNPYDHLVPGLRQMQAKIRRPFYVSLGH